MSDDSQRQPSAGQTIDDHCRVCDLSRRHTVLAVNPENGRVRVLCDTCGSQHNYRGGINRSRTAPRAPRPESPAPASIYPVSERERFHTTMDNEQSVDHSTDLELLLRRVMREELGITPVTPADKWNGGEMILRPGREGLQEKSWPVETFFQKIVMLRNRLRVLEQQVNGAEIPAPLKVKLQGYVTACYGSLTSFNVLFADEEDRFRGSGGK